MKRYFVWKDGIYNGEKTGWEEKRREEFLALVGSKSAKGRRFAYMPGGDAFEDVVVFETTESGYKLADAMRGIYKYNKKVEIENPIEIVSLDREIELPDGEMVAFYEMIPDQSAEFEERLINKLWVRSVVATLDPWERQLIYWKFPEHGTGKTEEEIAMILGINQSNVSRKLKKVYKKLRRRMKE